MSPASDDPACVVDPCEKAPGAFFELFNLSAPTVKKFRDFSSMTLHHLDALEGRKTVSHYIENLHIVSGKDPEIGTDKDVRALGKFLIMAIDERSENLSFKSMTISRQFSVPDCFLLCGSSCLSAKTMREFDGADACAEITEQKTFFACLTETLNSHSPVQFIGVFGVKYCEREEVWNGTNWGDHPAFIKGPSYVNQHAVRASGRPLNDKPISPIVLANYILGSYCSVATI